MEHFRWPIWKRRANVSLQHGLPQGQHCWCAAAERQAKAEHRCERTEWQLTHAGPGGALGAESSRAHAAVAAAGVLTQLVVAALVRPRPALVNICSTRQGTVTALLILTAGGSWG